jgi:DNA-binding LacI/PurR family transcriptional regulator
LKHPTIADIAKRAGVSKGAVSFALNGQAGVSASTRERVLAIAEEIGWSPNSVARMLSGASSSTIGMALRRPPRVLGVEPFFMELINGVETALSARSYALTLQVVADQAAEVALYRRWATERRVDGVLVCDLQVDDPRIPVLEDLGLPTVVIGSSIGAGRLVSVGSDDAATAVEAIGYLVNLGHRRLARVAGLPELLHTTIRSTAFDEECRRLEIAAPTTISTDYSGDDGARATRRLLSSQQRPTAIIYDNDVMAIAGLAAAHEMGFKVPDDVSLVAFDDSVLCRLVHPSLTAMSRDIPAYGSHAAGELLNLLTGSGPRPAAPSGELPATGGWQTHLVPRGSTAPPP